MKEHPIPFSGPMVNAILDGRKSQTRRICTHPYECAYGEVGDHLWVREAWRTGSSVDKLSGSQIAAKAIEAGYSAGCPIWYEADGCFRAWGDNDMEDFGKKGRYRHGRFMPRWASRITLAVTGIRVQRLQHITEEDAKAEGAEPWSLDPQQPMTTGELGIEQPFRGGFAVLWDEINDHRATWLSNPRVWAISFERVDSTSCGTKP